MAKKWTLANAVKKFKPNQKKSLNRNGGNLNVDEFNSLIKEMKRYYEVVEPDGIGRERTIWTDKKRKVKIKKEDKRQFNKGVAPPHSKHLALMVMSKMDGIDNKERTKNGWATYFGLISPAEIDVMNGIFSKDALKPYKAFMIKLGIIEDDEENVFQDLADTLSKVAKGQLQTVLDQAEEMELISRISSFKGKVKGSKEPIDIDKAMATEIKNMEAKLLKKHGITKTYSLMYRNSRKTKAFKAEWLEYIENVEDAEGDAMHLQYIYEVFRIVVLNEYAFDEYIKAHYPTEIDSFNLIKNEQSYHNKLFDYVADNAQKKRDNYLKKKHEKPIKSEEGMKELLFGLGFSEDEAIAYIEQKPEVDANVNELSPYMALLEGDGYVDCIKKIHIHLHKMSAIESQEVKAGQHRIDERMKKELAQLGLSNPAEVKNGISVKNRIRNYEEPSIETIEQREELTNIERIKQQANQAAKKIELENLEQQGIAIVDTPIVEPSQYCNAEGYFEYQAAMEDIRDEIRWYEDKYGDKAMERIALDSAVRQLTRKVTAEEMVAELTHQEQCVKERERKEWEKLFEGVQPVKQELTTNNPLEVFHKIRFGRI